MKEIRFTPKQKEKLASLGLETSEDILTYYPYRYEKTEYVEEAQWLINSRVVVEGTLVSRPHVYRYRGNRSVINFDLQGQHNVYHITVFNQIWYMKLAPGTLLTVVGKYEGQNKIVAASITAGAMSEVLGIRPVYRLKDKIRPKAYSQIVRRVLEANRDQIDDFIPEPLRAKYGLMHRYPAFAEVHFPTNDHDLALALQTLKYEEFLQFQSYMLYRKQQARITNAALAKPIDRPAVEQFIRRLPFTLTADQQKAVEEILTDLSRDYQMCRLLQGDVGSGKTVVAFIAMYATALAGQQSCLMVPTEILAKQHFANMQSMFAGYDLGIELLYSGLDNAQRQAARQRIADGQSMFIVGTHALFQQDVRYHDLGLIVTDEQHRFGVKQRQALQDKGNHADLLLMSATPIPRTLATSLYGDMDVSTITQTPNRHKVIHTRLIRQNSFLPVLPQIEQRLSDGDQMYVVCAAIEGDSESPSRNVTEIYRNLEAYFRGKWRIGLLHGQMSEEQKDAVQQRFADHALDILVTTTVIEVGVDVKNANLMVIYDANRFGLSQLHQLRGRVGRGQREGYCYLLTDTTDEEALKRLQVIVDHSDGFEISYYDLQLRGPGDILGTRQSGLPVFRLGNVVDDVKILNAARQDALEALEHLAQPEYRALKEYLERSADRDTVYLD